MNKRIEANFEIKSIDAQGEFEGYASVFGDLDWYKEIVAKGAFKKSLKSRMPAMLWQHDTSKVPGIWTSAKEDDRGLYVVGQLAINTVLGKDSYELLKMRAISSLSIGFMPVKFSIDQENKTLTHKELELFEISLVTIPALQSAQIESVKSFLEVGDMPTERSFEGFLRDAGFSRQQAKAIVSTGFKSLLRDAVSENTENQDSHCLDAMLKLKESINAAITGNKKRC
jgi:HK97 family phage prohead protease